MKKTNTKIIASLIVLAFLLAGLFVYLLVNANVQNAQSQSSSVKSESIPQQSSSSSSEPFSSSTLQSSSLASSVSIQESSVPQQDVQISYGKDVLQQGDIFVINLKYVPKDVKPVATTTLGMAQFVNTNEGEWFCAVPIANAQAVGEYNVLVEVGEEVFEKNLTVEEFEFDEQNLIIDNTAPEITEANSDEAYAEYRQKIPPLFETFDEEIYWNGEFIRPVEGGWISTEFGSIRYTNGNYENPRYHYGMDIAVGEGTPIVAPNNGRVVLAEYLLNTGNTIVIEHGGGLKSYYFHMVELVAKPDDMVQKGDLIGKVGTTGYSTGNHLHFEMRIGDAAISPSMLLESGAGLYSISMS
jgi:murein DD-endopeptidase MepM/ murein hydrolase activator NlpD